MKKILVAGIAAAAFCGTSAFAADMPVKSPVYKSAPAPVLSWTGCYVGANVGGGWGKDGNWTDAGGGVHGGQKFSGVIGGGQVGCDYQSGPWVVGVAGMFDWSNLKGNAIDPANNAFTAHSKVTQLDTATARLGYAVDRSLWYVDGGAAWSKTERFFTPTCATCEVDRVTKSGYTVGAGWEYMIAPNWSWKIEYNYAGFGTATADPDTAVPYRVKQHINTVLVGLNYRFGDWGKGPVSAKY
jgi:outer membrane immunogenic protein